MIVIIMWWGGACRSGLSIVLQSWRPRLNPPVGQRLSFIHPDKSVQRPYIQTMNIVHVLNNICMRLSNLKRGIRWWIHWFIDFNYHNFLEIKSKINILIEQTLNKKALVIKKIVDWICQPGVNIYTAFQFLRQHDKKDNTNYK